MKNTTVIAIMVASITAIAAPAFADGQRGGGKNRPSFAELDADNDGQISLADIQAAGAARFATIDTNQDGSISKEEMLAHAAGEHTNRMERRANRMINRMDTDGNGTIELSEMQSNGRGEKMIERLDADGNGTVSSEEFEARKGGRNHGRNHD